MVGENFEINSCQVAKYAFKLSTMVGENFRIYLSQVPKNAFKFEVSTINQMSPIFLENSQNP